MGEITIPIDVPDEGKLGPFMKNLNERRRAFVTGMIAFGGIDGTRAAMAAGFSPDNPAAAAVTAHRLLHDEDVLNAIHEEAARRLRSGAIMAVQTLLEIANNTSNEARDRLKAVEMLLNRSGLHAVTEHNVKVEHRDTTDEAMIAKIRMLAKKQGLDPATLLGSAGITIDAEFKEVPKNTQITENTQITYTTENSLDDIL